MIITNKKNFDNKLRVMRSHGWSRDSSSKLKNYSHIDPRYLFVNLGYNLRPTELQAAFGIEQIKKLRKFNNQRNYLANIFFNYIKTNIFLSHPIEEKKSNPCWFALPIIINKNKYFKKSQLIDFLEKKGVECRPIVVGDISKQPIKEIYPRVFDKKFPNARYIDDNAFYIGLSPMYDVNKIKKLINIFKIFFSKIEKNYNQV